MSFAPMMTYTLGAALQSQLTEEQQYSADHSLYASALQPSNMYPYLSGNGSDYSSMCSPYPTSEGSSAFPCGNPLRYSTSMPEEVVPMLDRHSNTYATSHNLSGHVSHESLSPLSEDASSCSSSPPSSTLDVGIHEILPLLPAGQSRPEDWVHSFRVAGKAMFKCTWPDCPRGIFRQAEKALDHVCGHIHIKQYTCTCGKIFVSSSTAKRHVAMQVKVYPCQFCPKKFARKDYLKVHESRCATNHRYSRQ